MFVDNIKNLSVWLVSDVAYISKSSYDRICKKIDMKLDGRIMDEEWLLCMVVAIMRLPRLFQNLAMTMLWVLSLRGVKRRSNP